MPLTKYYLEDLKRLDTQLPANTPRCCNYHASGGVYQGCNNFPLLPEEIPTEEELEYIKQVKVNRQRMIDEGLVSSSFEW